MKILALDPGKFNSVCCVFNPKSKKNHTELVKSERGYLRTDLEKHKPELVVMEACCASGWIHGLCQELGLPTLVCSTHEDGWRWRNVKR